MRLNAGTEFFSFLTGLDLTFLVWYDTGTVRINSRFVSIYPPLFGVLVVFSLILLAVAARVQSLIYGHIGGHALYYPFWWVFICWLFALTGIGFHLYVILGGAR